MRRRVLTVGAVLVALLAGLGVAVPAAAAQGPSPRTVQTADDTSDGGAYHAVTPTRLLDTRKAIGVPAPAKVGKDKTLSLNVFSPPHVAADPIPSTATAVVLNITVVDVTVGGHLTAYPGGTAMPGTSTINFYVGRDTPNLAVLRIGTGGTVELTNTSGGAVDLLADAAGYFEGPVSADGQGTFHALPSPVRRLKTAHPVVHGSRTLVPVTGAGVPADASSVVVNVAAVDPSVGGHLTAYPTGGSPGHTSTLNFTRGHNIANLAVVPVGSGGRITIENQSGATTGLLADVSGYFTGGDPTGAGGLGSLTPTRLTGTPRSLGPRATTTLSVSGRGGVPITTGAAAGRVQAVVLNVTAVSPSTGGHLTVWEGGQKDPGVSNLNFAAHQNVANLVVAPVSDAGTVEIGNGPSGTVGVLADVTGYVLGQSASVPSVSTSRYVRNITGASSDRSTMQAEGQADCAGGSKLVLLDIGAQSNAIPPGMPSSNGVVLTKTNPGVVLSQTLIRLTYNQLLVALEGYQDGFGNCSGTIAIGTNTGGDWDAYPSADKASDWASKVVLPMQAYARTKGYGGESIVGASDIEASFAATAQQERTWVTDYLQDAGNGSTFIDNGSLDNCPATYEAPGDCGPVQRDDDSNAQWTFADYAALTHDIAPGRISVLPQVYFQSQAIQWANLDAHLAGSLDFSGSLTEYAADPTGLDPSQGWAALVHALSTVVTSPSVPQVTDLRADDTAADGRTATPSARLRNYHGG